MTGMIKTRNLPAPTCSACGRRIGYNQRSKWDRNRGWRHEHCQPTDVPGLRKEI